VLFLFIVYALSPELYVCICGGDSGLPKNMLSAIGITKDHFVGYLGAGDFSRNHKTVNIWSFVFFAMTTSKEDIWNRFVYTPRRFWASRF
jgi:hypothetical protein